MILKKGVRVKIIRLTLGDTVRGLKMDDVGIITAYSGGIFDVKFNGKLFPMLKDQLKPIPLLRRKCIL